MVKNKRIHWAKVDKRMAYSKAYLSLGNPASKIMTYLLFELDWENIGTSNKPKYICTNKNEIKLPYKAFKNNPFCMNVNSITRGIDELLAKGFIDIVKQGGKVKGHSSIFKIAEGWKKWVKGDLPISTRRPFVTRGFTREAKK